MEAKDEDVRLGANKFNERQPLGTAAQTRDYSEPPATPLIEPSEFTSWSFWRAGIAEFFATLLFLYITIQTVMGFKHGQPTAKNACPGVGIQGIAWAFGGMIFALVYCTAGISGGHINPAVTWGLFLARKGFQPGFYEAQGGGANAVAHGYTKGDGLGAEIVGTFVLVYTVFSATDAKRSARDSHVPLLAPLPIGFAVFLVHLATIPITGTGINPARSLGATIIYNKKHAWDDHWIFWVGPFIEASQIAKDFVDIEGEPKEEFLALDLKTSSQKLLEAPDAFDLCLKRVAEKGPALKDEDFEARLVELGTDKSRRDVVEPNKHG
ncbi:hypothetical protein L7F22_039960 [Adiantum nelumboides]|nr:hypothetical protein [Adiantum nelumboides]